jgi:hypothetical protein
MLGAVGLATNTKLFIILALPSFNLRPENHLSENIISNSKKFSFSTRRLYSFADRIKNEGSFIIRLYSYYISVSESYRISFLNKRYK